MWLKVKTLSRQTIEVQLKDASQTVEDVKHILEDMGAGAASELTLLYKGRVVHDETTIDSLHINADTGFLVMMVRKKKERTRSEAVREKAPEEAAPQQQQSLWTGHHTVGLGDACEAAWPKPDMSSLEWWSATLIGIDSVGNGTVRWADGSYTKGVQPRFIRAAKAATEKAACGSNESLQDMDTMIESSDAMNENMPAPEEAHELLQMALTDPQFQAFLSSDVFVEIFEPLKRMVAKAPHRVAVMVQEMQAQNPHMAALVLPFLLAELETRDPDMAAQLAASCK